MEAKTRPAGSPQVGDTSAGAARLASATTRLAMALLVLAGLASCGTAPLSLSPAEAVRLSAEQKRLLDVQTRLRPSPTVRASTMARAATPMPLPPHPSPPPITWRLADRTYTVDDYLERQPVMALLIAKDGQVVYERYKFGRTAHHLFLSNSIAKSFTGLATLLAQREGRIPDLDVPAQHHLPALAGSAYGETTLRNLVRMGSGVRFNETNEPGDDLSRFRQDWSVRGVVAAARQFDQREVPQGTRFRYSGTEPALMSAVLRAATGQNVADYLQSRLWQAVGAEADASWFEDPTGLNLTLCCILARPRDYLRLGIVLANDGRRPDTGALVIPRDALVAATDWHRADPPFRPRSAAGWGYEHYFWLQGGETRRFAMLGLRGQAVFVDPTNRLTMVHFAVNDSPHMEATTMARERAALWRGVVQALGRW